MVGVPVIIYEVIWHQPDDFIGPHCWRGEMDQFVKQMIWRVHSPSQQVFDAGVYAVNHLDWTVSRLAIPKTKQIISIMKK